MPWMGIAFLPPLLYAVTNIIDRVLLEKKIKNPFVSFLVLAMIGLILSCLILVLHPFPLLSWPLIGESLLAGVFLGIMFALYFIVLQKEEASRVINLIYLFPIISFFGETIFLHTRFGLPQIIGIVLSVIGAAFTVLKPQEKKTISWNVLLLLGISIVVNGSLRTFEKYLLYQIPPLSLVPIEYGGILLVGIVILLGNSSVRREFTSLFSHQKRVLSAAITSEIIGYIADVLFIVAATFVPITLVSVISTSQVIFVLLLTFFFSMLFPHILTEVFDKKTLSLKIISTLCIAGGIVLITV